MLLGLLPQIYAWEQLHDPKVAGTLDAEGILELCLAAGLGENAAQKIAKRRAEDRMRLELPP